MEKDASTKRAQFIDAAVRTREMFKFAAPMEIVKSLKLYNNAFYGSNLWDYQGEKCLQVFSAWRTAIKIAWGCPLQTRSYFVQQILSCGFTSARTDLLTRFVKFFHSLRFSASFEVRFFSRLISRNVQSTTGKNLSYIADLTKMNPWSASLSAIGDALVQNETVEVPPEDKWRLQYFCTLQNMKFQAYYEARNEDVAILGAYIESLVIN